MKESPILFSAPMVRALLAGTKTQTRRIVKARDLEWMDVHQGLREPDNAERCPYGQPGGDRLYVRETFGHFERNENFAPGCEVFYRADGESLAVEPWRPSIHMPRWASRITLEITGVRVERLQEISEADAKAEGADCLTWSGIEGTAADLIDWPLKEVAHPHRNGFAVLWESINGPESWNANPWVWVVSFRRLDAKEPSDG